MTAVITGAAVTRAAAVSHRLAAMIAATIRAMRVTEAAACRRTWWRLPAAAPTLAPDVAAAGCWAVNTVLAVQLLMFCV